ncbi:uncharacterized protein K452DRAFT_286166 [Aplosporella prunicola CBS 121167]|uniref:Aminotransferase class I/classII large domain-containing protein n=1 Tax=Aplosporella prunicola CBS 121167 TaxID=1176127 RepID=A0A6A6BGQ7_9PEZI|nr:uncharacterized protein K452DRAFT_286166 [Aplosporella prunicola CBS 121167]KAF2143342.1 hypothetical protein K452DRAFT_286166 [Aplosporella prunicola CBS 121167]
MPAKPLINLLRGWPSATLLPVALLRRAAERAFDTPELACPGLSYGPDAGHPNLRKSIASWLSDFYGTRQPIHMDRITITGGASQNLACLLQVFTDPLFTRNIWISSPAYMLAFRIFDDSGFHGKLRSVPETAAGIDVDFLRREISKSEQTAAAEANLKPTIKPQRPWAKVYRHVIYVVPSFSNPSSVTMPLDQRTELVKLAREHDALIICDDVYDFLQWPASADAQQSSLRKATCPRLVDVDRYLDGGAERKGADGFGNVVSNGSFSKISGPGIRTGWVEGTPQLAHGVSQTGSTRSGGAPSQLTATYMSLLLESGELQEHIYGTLQPAYAARHRTMVAAITKHLVPLGVRMPLAERQVDGGFFVWLTLPDPLRAASVARRAQEEENLVVAEGEMFEVPGDSAAIRHACDVRLCFSWEGEEQLVEGVERLGRVIGREQQQGRGQAVAEAVTGANSYW